MKTRPAKKFRPDLSGEYARMVGEMTEELNSRSMCGLSNTDIVKMCIERGYQNLFPDRAVAVKRRRFVEMPF